jgi:hypothetical protein
LPALHYTIAALRGKKSMLETHGLLSHSLRAKLSSIPEVP